MLRALCEAVGIVETPPDFPADNPKFTQIPDDFQKRIAQDGVRHNIKLVIRGARGTGKTALLHRLQGKPVPPSYIPSQAIAAATVRWTPTCEEEHGVVRVEAWDVVDRGTATAMPTSTAGRITCEAPANIPKLPTDATTVDVYRGCHGAIFLADIRREETFDYVASEVKKVPRGIAVLVAQTFCDREEERVVSEDQFAHLLASIAPATSAFVASLGPSVDACVGVPPCMVKLSPTSGVGLKALYSFIEVPLQFLKAQLVEEQLARQYKAVADAFAAFSAVAKGVARTDDRAALALASHRTDGDAADSYEQFCSSSDDEPNPTTSAQPRVAGPTIAPAPAVVGGGNGAHAPRPHLSDLVADAAVETLDAFFGNEPADTRAAAAAPLEVQDASPDDLATGTDDLDVQERSSRQRRPRVARLQQPPRSVSASELPPAVAALLQHVVSEIGAAIEVPDAEAVMEAPPSQGRHSTNETRRKSRSDMKSSRTRSRHRHGDASTPSSSGTQEVEVLAD